MTNIVDTLIEQLKELPEEEQKKHAVAFLEELRRRKQAKRDKETTKHPSRRPNLRVFPPIIPSG